VDTQLAFTTCLACTNPFFTSYAGNSSSLLGWDQHDAIDGSHIDAHIDSLQAAAYWNQKGRLSTNILAACTLDLCFCYLLVGWEGSATDSRIFKDAQEHGLAIPPGKFYLADAGFLSCDALLVPY